MTTTATRSGNVASGLHYDAEKKHPILVEVGAHGIRAELIEFEAEVLGEDGLPPNPGDSILPLEVPEDAWTLFQCSYAAPRSTADEDAFCSIDAQPIVEFISFGRSHRYLATAFDVVAPHFKDLLLRETRLLARSLQGDAAIAREFLEGDGSVGAWLSHGIDWVKQAFLATEDVTPEDYDPLQQRVWQAWRAIKKSDPLDYGKMHAAGIEFMRIRWEQAQIRAKVNARLESLIASARFGQRSAELTEDISFSVLDLYGQARYSHSPAQLAAYRIGILALRAGGRATGEWIADSSSRRIWTETVKVVRQGTPPIVVGLLQGAIKKGFRDPNQATPSEEFALALVELQLVFIFDTIDYYVFEAEKYPANQREDKYFEFVVPRMIDQSAQMILKVFAAKKVGSLGNDAARKEAVQRLAAALGALISGVIGEYQNAKKIADKEKRPVIDVVLSELGWILMRLLKKVGFAYGSATVQKRMAAKIESDPNLVRSLRLTLHLQLADIRGKTKGLKSPIPVVRPASKPDADAEESIMTGLAHEKAPTEVMDPDEPPTTKAEPLTRSQYREVKPTEARRPRNQPVRKTVRKLSGRKTEVDNTKLRDSNYHEELAASFIAKKRYDVLGDNDDEVRTALGVARAAPCADLVARKQGEPRKFILGEPKGDDADKALSQLQKTWGYVQSRFGKDAQGEFYIFVRPGVEPRTGQGRYVVNGRLMDAAGKQVRIDGKVVHVIELWEQR